jgi:hypothetical protein
MRDKFTDLERPKQTLVLVFLILFMLFIIICLLIVIIRHFFPRSRSQRKTGDYFMLENLDDTEHLTAEAPIPNEQI